MHDRPSANSLAQSLAAGETDAFAKLYDRCAARMLRVAHSLLKDSAAAEDAVHDAFVALARHRERLARVRDVDAYLFIVLRNTIATMAASTVRHQRHMQKLAMMQDEYARSIVACDDDLETALLQLSPSQREVVALKVDAELTFAQIGDVLGISPNTAASRYRYAIEKLRDFLNEKDR